MGRLLQADEPSAVSILREGAQSPFVLTCDHASKRIPRALGDLGLPASELERHIAWDIGVAGVVEHLSESLDAIAVLQNYSRLVIDCNRPPNHPTSIPPLSEATPIPANEDLNEAEKASRREEIFEPYHQTINDIFDARRHRETAFVSIHSFTPSYLGEARPWHIGILYGSDDRMARPMLEHYSAMADVTVGDNEPYRIDEKDYGTPVYGEARGLIHVLIELRQDLIADAAGQREWAEKLAPALRIAYGIAGTIRPGT